ncbi:unnamed protein product [Peniophora sp. CBMAI 1063]|nr:unnamed protein product [Peniophora sp. CBMAI 1063]
MKRLPEGLVSEWNDIILQQGQRIRNLQICLDPSRIVDKRSWELLGLPMSGIRRFVLRAYGGMRRAMPSNGVLFSDRAERLIHLDIEAREKCINLGAPFMRNLQYLSLKFVTGLPAPSTMLDYIICMHALRHLSLQWIPSVDDASPTVAPGVHRSQIDYLELCGEASGVRHLYTHLSTVENAAVHLSVGTSGDGGGDLLNEINTRYEADMHTKLRRLDVLNMWGRLPDEHEIDVLALRSCVSATTVLETEPRFEYDMYPYSLRIHMMGPGFLDDILTKRPFSAVSHLAIYWDEDYTISCTREILSRTRLITTLSIYGYADWAKDRNQSMFCDLFEMLTGSFHRVFIGTAASNSILVPSLLHLKIRMYTPDFFEGKTLRSLEIFLRVRAAEGMQLHTFSIDPPSHQMQEPIRANLYAVLENVTLCVEE